MKKLSLFAGLSIMLASSSLYAEVCSTDGHRYENHFDGPTQCGSGTVDQSTTVSGPLTLNGTTIAADFIANGPLQGDHVTVGSGQLMTHGVSQFTNSTLQSLHSYGPLIATSSTLGNDIMIYTTVAFLNQTTTGDLTIKDTDHHPFTTPHLHVDSHSVVKGDITFVGNPGIVFVDSTSTPQGKIINGSKVADTQDKIDTDTQRIHDYRHNDNDEDDNDNDNEDEGYNHHHHHHYDDE